MNTVTDPFSIDNIMQVKDYTIFRRYMIEECEFSGMCKSCICPLDSRLNSTDLVDANLSCQKAYYCEIKSGPLFTLVKKHCANWDTTICSCLGVLQEDEFVEGQCRVSVGKPCSYFESAVFPVCSPTYKFATETKHFAKYREAYMKIRPKFFKSIKGMRVCECRTPLKKGHRFCGDCMKKRKKESQKKSRMKSKARGK